MFGLTCVGVGIVTPAYGKHVADLSMARRYAASAVAAKGVAQEHRALQQALNCLVGSTGAGYDAAVPDTCSKVGILASVPRSSTTHIEAQKAAQIAEVGLSTSDPGVVQKIARAVDDLLNGKGVQGEYN